jgi:xylulokinase
MTLVAGIDSSTQACKVVVRDAETGRLRRQGRADHPGGTEIHPGAWWAALQEAIAEAGGLDGVDGVAVAAQQHGCVCLDDDGEVLRPALLWNDTRSAAAAYELVTELGTGDDGRRAWAKAVGSVPVAAFTVTKLRWLAEHEPETVRRTAAVCLPHDWLTWRLTGATGRDALEQITTDRSDASGTGYWSPATGKYRLDLLERALGRGVLVPRVLGPREPAGETADAALLGAGTGDNAGAALGLGAAAGEVIISIGTSGTVFAVSDTATADPSATVAGFADATGRFLPLVCTLNAARVLDATARLLRVDHTELSRMALSAPAGADGLVLVPYLEGERTPDRPNATGAIHGLTLTSSSPAHVARAAIEGLLCGLADGLDALVGQGVRVERVLLVGGGARSEALRRIAPAILGFPVVVPAPGEYVADGAARQAAWALAQTEDPPAWGNPGTEVHEADPMPTVREQYARVRDLTATRTASSLPARTNIS